MQNIDFKFDIDFYGDAVVEFCVDDEHYEFSPTYVGKNPLNSLIVGLYSLERNEEDDVTTEIGWSSKGFYKTHKMIWQGEPEGQTVELTKKGEELHIAVSHFSDIEHFDHHSFAFCDLTLVFEAHTSYEDFKNKVCGEAIRMLHKFGVAGYVESWGNDGEEFPLSKLLYLRGNTIKRTDNDSLHYSDFSDELSSLTQ